MAATPAARWRTRISGRSVLHYGGSRLDSGLGKRPYSWAGSIAVDHELAPGVALSAGFYRTQYGNFTVTRNTAVNPTDFSPYCITAPLDARLPANVSGQQVCGLYDVNPDKYGQVANVVTLASNYGNPNQYDNGADVNIVARLPRASTSRAVGILATQSVCCRRGPE